MLSKSIFTASSKGNFARYLPFSPGTEAPSWPPYLASIAIAIAVVAITAAASAEY